MSKRVLVIDDDHEFAEAMINVLEAKGYEVSHAPNGKVGIAKARERKPDIVLLDVMMNTKSEGLDVARELHKDEKLKSVPIILVTGVRKEMSLPFGFEPDDTWLPVKGVLEKPVKPDVLLRTVQENINA
jgi:two-component system, OmpR family, alkaline phosphatase synthesis response regulator PhoP